MPLRNGNALIWNWPGIFADFSRKVYYRNCNSSQTKAKNAFKRKRKSQVSPRAMIFVGTDDEFFPDLNFVLRKSLFVHSVLCTHADR